MSSLLRLSSQIDSVSDRIGRILSWLTALLVVSVFMNVVLRYLFSNSKIWLSELSWHLFAILFLLGAAYALRHDRHVRVDVFYSRFSPRIQAAIDLSGTVLFLIPFCLLVISTSWGFAQRSLAISERSPEPGGLPALYLIKFAIVVGFVLLLIQAIALLMRSVVILTTGIRAPE